MSDPLQNFFKSLKPSKDVHSQFFTKSSGQTSFSNNVQLNGNLIVPYRNPKCTQLQCVYAASELRDMFENEGGLSYTYSFSCKFCNSDIVIKSFVLDTVLQKCFEEAYKQNNKPNMKIEVLKDGTWKPSKEKVINQLEDLQQADLEEEKQKHIPDIGNFSLDDYKRLLAIYVDEWSKVFQFMDRAFEAYGVQVKFSDVYEIIFKSEVTVELMRFLISYLQNQNLKDKHKWKMYFIGVNIANYDEVKNEGTFYYLDGLEQTLGFAEVQKWEYISIISRFERVWTLHIYRVRDKQVFCLNYYHLAQAQMIAKYLFSCILGIKNPNLKFLPAFEIERVDELQYSGNLLFIFFYNLLLEKDFSHMQSATKEGIRMIKKQIESLKWLILESTEKQLPEEMPPPRSNRTPQSSQLSQKSIPPSKQKTPPPPTPPPKTPLKEQTPRPVTQERISTPPRKSPSIIPTQKSQSNRTVAVSSPVLMPYKSNSKLLQPDEPKQPSNRYNPMMIQPSSLQKEPSSRNVQPSQQPSQRLSYVPQQQKGNDVVQLTKEELVQLLEKVRQNVLYEVKNPPTDLAKKYVDEIDNFNVKTDKLDYSLPNSLRNQSILLTGQEMYNILDKFKKEVKDQVTDELKNGINYIDPELERQEAERNQQQFQQILWYYYQYNPEMFHNQLLEKMGLKEQFSNTKMPQQARQSIANNPNQRGSIMNNNGSTTNVRGSILNNNGSTTNVRGSMVNNNGYEGNPRASVLNNNGNSNNRKESIIGNTNSVNSSYRDSMDSNNYRGSLLNQPNNSNQFVRSGSNILNNSMNYQNYNNNNRY